MSKSTVTVTNEDTPRLNGSSESTGRLVSLALAGSWRASPPRFDLESAQLEAITPQLVTAGVGGLVSRRLSNSALRTSDAASQLRRQYRLNTALALLQRKTIEQLVECLGSNGIKPMVVKGWAAARLYGDDGLRPFGDIDVCVPQRQFEAAERALKTLSDTSFAIDLHCEFEKFGGGSYDEIYSRADMVKVARAEVRMPSPEDHLRILSIHMLREGAWRPLWLCDVAAAVESRSADFDWRVCIGQDPLWSNWIIHALKLAHELLGANISDTPAAEDATPLPRWLIPAVLREWSSSLPSMSRRHQAPMASHLRSPSTLFSGFRHRWPNPIEGTIVAGGLFNESPRLPFQVGAYLMRGARFAMRRPKRQQ